MSRREYPQSSSPAVQQSSSPANYNPFLRSTKRSILIATILFLLASKTEALADTPNNYQAKANYADTDKIIPKLTWASEPTLPVQIRTKPDGATELYVTIKGAYAKPEYSVLIDAIQKNQNNEQNFEDEIVITGDVTYFNLDLIGPKGDLTRNTFEITLPEYTRIKDEIASEDGNKKLSGAFSMGATYLDYKQTNQTAYSEWLWTIRASGTYKINKSWELSANTFINALSLYSNQDDSIKFFGANVRAGYVIHKPLSPWRFTINGGWYYVTTFGSPIGFTDLNGPQIYPNFSYKINTDESAFGYLKYSPIADKFSLLSLSNREIALGGGYNFKAFGKHLTAGLDLAFISVTFPNIKTESTSLTASVGMRF